MKLNGAKQFEVMPHWTVEACMLKAGFSIVLRADYIIYCIL